MEKVKLVLSVMRHIWLRRNNFVFEGKFISPWMVFQKAKASLIDFQRAQQKGMQGSESGIVERELVKWEAPREGYVKVN